MIFTALKENNSLEDSLKQIFFFNASLNHFLNAKFFMSRINAILLMCGCKEIKFKSKKIKGLQWRRKLK